MDKEQAFARFHKALGYLQDARIVVKYEEMADKIGIKKTALSNAIQNKDRRFTEGFLKRFAAAYSDYINEAWLLTGEGDMARRDSNTLPFYEAEAAAGFMDGVSEGRMSAEFRARAIPMLNYDFSIRARGNSMTPKIESGDVLLCRKVNDRLNPPIGEICVLDTKDGAVVKVISSATESTLTLHSLNPRYGDYEIDIDTINGLAVVVGLTRTF